MKTFNPSVSLQPTPALLLWSLLMLGVVLLSGCFFMGSNKSSSPCENIFNQYAAKAVTSSECASAPRGEWFEGRCYCHRTAEDAQK